MKLALWAIFESCLRFVSVGFLTHYIPTHKRQPSDSFRLSLVVCCLIIGIMDSASRSTRNRPAPMTAEELSNKDDEDLSIRDMMNLLVSVDNKMTGLDTRLQTIEDRLKGIEGLSDAVENVKQELKETKEQVKAITEAEDAFPANVSVIISRLPAPDDETEASLMDDVIQLIEDGLELLDIDVRAVQRVKPRTFAEVAHGEDVPENTAGPTGPGLVKVRLSSVSQKVSCLRAKRKLNANRQYERVYLNNCEDHASRVGRLNMETLLVELGKTEKFSFTGSGRMVRTDGTAQGGGRGAPYRGGRHRGRGRGWHGGRGGHGDNRGRGRGEGRGGGQDNAGNS